MPAPPERAEVNQCSVVAWAAVAAYRSLAGEPNVPGWPDAPEDERTRFQGLISMIVAHPGVGPRQLHVEWCRAMQVDGWKHGEHRNGQNRTHPWLVSWNVLPEPPRRHYALMCQVCLALTGFT